MRHQASFLLSPWSMNLRPLICLPALPPQRPQRHGVPAAVECHEALDPAQDLVEVVVSVLAPAIWRHERERLQAASADPRPRRRSTMALRGSPSVSIAALAAGLASAGVTNKGSCSNTSGGMGASPQATVRDYTSSAKGRPVLNVRVLYGKPPTGR